MHLGDMLMCPPSYPLPGISSSVFGEQRAVMEFGEGDEMCGMYCMFVFVCDAFFGGAE